MDNGKKELERMFNTLEQELEDYNNKDNLDFLLKYEYNFKDEVIKDYKYYIKDNDDLDPEEIMGYDDWIEEYKTESEDELSDRVREYFNALDIKTFKDTNNDENFIYDIQITWGGPNIDMRVETRWESVKWKGYWGGTNVQGTLSHYYNIIMDLYNLDI